MTYGEYKLIPLQNTQSFTVDWKFSQNDYNKLVNGHRSNWCVFLRGDVVHVCRVSGEEFYRFTLEKSGNETYVANNLETYIAHDFNASAKSHGLLEEDVEQRQGDFRKLAVEDVAGLLVAYFDVNVTQKTQ